MPASTSFSRLRSLETLVLEMMTFSAWPARESHNEVPQHPHLPVSLRAISIKRFFATEIFAFDALTHLTQLQAFELKDMYMRAGNASDFELLQLQTARSAFACIAHSLEWLDLPTWKHESATQLISEFAPRSRGFDVQYKRLFKW